MTPEDVRKTVLLTLIELAVTEGSSRESLVVGLDAHELLTGKPFEERAHLRDQMASLYPQFFKDPTQEEIDWAKLTTGKERPISIYNVGDATAYYNATEEERQAWNSYAQNEADKASDDLDMGESLSAYTSVDRDGELHSWAPPLWFPEWLAKRQP